MDPKDLLNNPEQIKSLIALLQAMLPVETNNVVEQPKKTRKKNNHQPTVVEESEPVYNNNIKTKNRKQIQATSVNKFEKMSEFNMHKDDRVIDEKLSKHPPVARTREFEPITVTCRLCGKKETVNPSLVHDSASRYKCNNCSTQAG